MNKPNLKSTDPQIHEIISGELKRQQDGLLMIPSENYPSKSVMEAVGSVMMHKYSEGYPGARYYQGTEQVDKLENLVRDRALEIFGLSKEGWHANVQVLSGSTANLAVYNSVLGPGDKILSMYLPDGGHLSHGWSYSPKSQKSLGDEKSMVYRGGSRKVNFISKIFDVVQYKTNPKTNLFDYDFIEKLAKIEKPKMIITGGTAYSREIDYKKMSEIAKKVGAYYLADVAHEAGLIAGGAMKSPFDYADFITFTTHKTLRGPRGAVAMCRKKFAKKLDKSVMPGLQGGPFNHQIAGIGVALKEAMTEEFNSYAHQIVKNAKILAEELKKRGFNLITGGTDKHLILIDIRNFGTNGSVAAEAFEQAGIILNKNTIPWEIGSPANPSGIRIGTPCLTSRGMKELEMVKIAEFFERIIKNLENKGVLAEIRAEVLEMVGKFAVY